jgi:hypothetical protein
VLEVETDIKHAIERLDEKREKARNRDATAPINNPNKADKSEYLPETRKPDLKAEPPNENPEKKVEMDRLA